MSKTRERLVKLILSAVMIALSIAMTRMLPQEMVLALFGQTPLTVRLGLGLIPIYFASMALGPGWGAAVGGLADLLGYFVNPFGGAFFLPITLAAALTAAIPGDRPVRPPLRCGCLRRVCGGVQLLHYHDLFAGNFVVDAVFRPVLAAARLHAYYERRVRTCRVRPAPLVPVHGRAAAAETALKKLAGFSKTF